MFKILLFSFSLFMAFSFAVFLKARENKTVKLVQKKTGEIINIIERQI